MNNKGLKNICNLALAYKAILMEDDIQKWDELVAWFENEFKMEADVDAMLFMIGVQELGKGFVEFGKTEKLELIHVGICSVLMTDGYYRFTHRDKDGWPHYESKKKLPYVKGQQQKAFIKKYLLKYFEAFIKN